VVELVWPNDPESYAGGSVTIGRASYARQVKVKSDDVDKKDALVLQFGGWT